MLTAAGFTDVRAEQVAGRFVLPSADDYLRVIEDTAGPIGLALRRLSDEERAAVRTDVEGAFVPFAATEGYVLPCVALCAAAERPSGDR